ncbi:uncharacterized protein [Ptychodera flava]|uniref:uncharacterized protein n=1 Tax=Ptychodera flava TaxID=63121 RepID=UPI00396A11C0
MKFGLKKGDKSDSESDDDDDDGGKRKFKLKGPKLPSFGLKFGGKKGKKKDAGSDSEDDDDKKLKLKGPKLDVDTPKLKGGDGDLNLGLDIDSGDKSIEKEGEIDIKAGLPSVDIGGGADIDVDGGKLSGKGGLQGDVDVPSVDVKGDGNIDLPGMKFGLKKGDKSDSESDDDDDGGKSKFKLKGPKLPSFGLKFGGKKGKKGDSGSDSEDDDDKKLKLKGPKLDVDTLKLKGGDGDLNLGLDIDSGDKSIEKEGDIDIKAGLPSVDIGGGADIDVDGGKLSGKGGLEGDVDVPSVDVKGDGNIDLPGMKFGLKKGDKSDSESDDDDDGGKSKFKLKGPKLPSFGLKFGGKKGKKGDSGSDSEDDDDKKLKLKGPKLDVDTPKLKGGDGDLNLGLDIDSGDKSIEKEGDIDIKAGLPSLDIGGGADIDVDGGKLSGKGGLVGDVDVPSVDVKGDGNIDLPGMKFGLKKGDKSDSESDDDDDGGKSKFKLKGPKLPSFGLKFGGKKGKKKDAGSDSEDDDDKKLKLKGPKLDVDTPKLKGGDGDLNLGLDIDSGDKSIEKEGDIDIKAGLPSVDIGGGADIDVDGGNLSGKGGLEGDVDVPSVDVKGDGNIDLPGMKFGLKKGDKSDSESDDDDDGGKRKFKLKGPKLPSFGLKFGGKKGKKGDSGSDSEDDDDKKLKLKGPKLDVDTPKLKGGDGDLNLGLDIDSGDKSIEKEGDIDIKAGLPSLDIGGGADIDVDGGKLSGKRGFEGDVDVPSVDIKGDGNIDLPGMKFGLKKGDKSDSESDDDDDGGKRKFKLKGPKLPSFGLKFGGKKGKKGDSGSDSEDDDDKKLKLKGPKIDVDTPKLKGGDGDLNLGLDIDSGGKSIEKEGDIDIKAGLPSLDIGGGADIDVDGGKLSGKGGLEGDVDVPSVDVKGDGNIDLPGMKFGLKKGDKSDSDSDDDDDRGKRKFKLKGPKLPSFGLKFGGKKGKKGDSGSDSEDDDDKKLKLKGPKIDVDTPKLKGGDGDLNLGLDIDSGDKSIVKEGDVDLKAGLPSLDIDGSADIGVDGGKLSGAGGVEHDVDVPSVGLTGDGNIDVPGMNIGLKKGDKASPELDEVKGKKKLKFKGPKLPSFKLKGGGKFKMPGFKFGGKKGKRADHESDSEDEEDSQKLKLEGMKADVGTPNIKGDSSLNAGLDIDSGGKSIGKDVDVDIKAGLPSLDIGSTEHDIEAPSIDLKGDGNIDMPAMKFGLKKGDKSESESDDDDDEDGHKKKHRFKGPKLPSFRLKGGGKFKMPGIKFGGKKGKKGDSGSDSEDDDDERKLKLKGMKLDVDTPKIKGGDGDLNLGLGIGDLSTEKDVDAHLKAGMPSLDIGGRPDMNVHGGVGHDVDMPSGDLKGDGNIDLPGIKFGYKKGDKSDSESDDDDDGSKRKMKFKGPKLPSFGLKMPKFKFGGKKGKAGDSGSDSEDDDEKKLKLKGMKLDVDTPKVKGGDGDLNLGLDIDSGDKSIAKDGDVGLKTGLPSLNIGGGGDIDVDGGKLSGGGVGQDVDVPSVDLKGDGKIDLPGMKFGLKKGDNSDSESDDDDGKGKLKFKGPKLPSFGLKMPGIKFGGKKGKKGDSGSDSESDDDERKLKLKGMKLDVDTPKVKGGDGDLNFGLDIDSGKLNIEKDVDVGVKAGFPSLDIDGGGDLDIGGGKLSGKGSMEQDVDVPSVDLKGDGNIDLPGMKFGLKKGDKSDSESDDDDNEGRSKFKFKGPKLPSFGLKFGGKKGKKGDSGSDSESDDERKLKLKGMKLDVDTPKIKGGDGDLNFGLDIDPGKPSIEKDVDVDVKAGFPSLDIDGGGDLDIGGGKLSGKGGVEHDVDVPSVDLKGDGNIDLPGMKFGLKKGDKSDSESDDDDDDGRGKFKFKGPKLPSFGLKFGGKKGKKGDSGSDSEDDDDDERKLKLKGPKLDVDTPKIKGGDGDLNFGLDIDSGKPSVDKDVDVGLKTGLPSLDIGGGGDIDVDGGKLSGKGGLDHDVDVPSVDIKGDGNIDLPSMKFGLKKGDGSDSESDDDDDGKGKLKFKGPKLPSFGLKMPGIKFGGKKGKKGDSGSDSESDDDERKLKLKGMKLDVDTPKVKGGDGDLNFGLDIDSGKPNIEKDVDVDVKAGFPSLDIDGGGDLDIGGGKLSGEGGLGQDVDVPSVDLKGDGNIDLPGMKFGLKKGDKSDSESDDDDGKGKLKLKGPKLPSFGLKMPGIKFGGKKGKREDSGSDSEDDDGESKFKLKGMKLDVDTPKVKGGDGDLNFGLDLDSGKQHVEQSPGVEVPDASLGIEGGAKIGINGSESPDVDLPSVKFKGGKKIKGRDLDLEMGSGKKGGLFKVCICKGKTDSAPSSDSDDERTIKLKGGNLDIDTPKVGGGEGDIGVGIDIDTDGARVKKDVSVDVTEPDASLNIGSGADIDVDGIKGTGDVDVNLPLLKGKGGKKIHGKDLDLEMGRGKKGGLLKVCMCKGKTDSASSDSEDDDTKMKFKLKGGNLDVDTPKIGGGKGDIDVGFDVDTDASIVERDVAVDVRGPDASLKGTGADFGVGALDVTKPDASLKIGSGADIDLDGSKGTGDVDVDLPSLKVKGGKRIHGKDLDLEMGSGKKGGLFKVCICKGKTDSASSESEDDDTKMKFKLKGGNLDVDTPKVGGGKGDVDVGINIDTDGPRVEKDLAVDVAEPEGSLNIGAGADIDIGAVDVTEPDASLKIGSGADIDLDGSKGTGDVDVDLPLLKGKGGKKIQGKDIDLEMGRGKKGGLFKVCMCKGKTDSASSESEDDDTKMKFKLKGGNLDVDTPKIGGGKGDVDFGINIDTDGQRVEKDLAVDVSEPEGSLNIGADADIDKPDASLKIGSGADIDLDGSKGTGDVDVDLPSLKVKGGKKIKGKDLDLEMGSGKKGGLFKVCMCKGKTDSASSDSEDDDTKRKFKLKGGNWDVDTPKVGGGKGDIDVGIDIDTDGPRVEKDVSVDVTEPDASLNIGSGADIDIDGSKGTGDVDVDLPLLKGKGGKKIHGKDLDLGMGRGKKGGLFKVCMCKGKTDSASSDSEEDDTKMKFKLKGGNLDVDTPKIGGGKGDIDVGMDIDTDGSRVEKDASLDVRGPDASLQMGTGADIDIGAVDITKPDASLKIGSGADIDIDGSKGTGDADVDLPSLKVKGGKKIHGKDLDLGMGRGKKGGLFKVCMCKGKTDSASSDSEEDDTKMKFKLKGGSLDVDTPKIGGGKGDIDVGMDIDTDGSRVEKDASLDVRGPDASLQMGTGADIDFGAGDVSKPDASLKIGTGADIDLDGGDIAEPDASLKIGSGTDIGFGAGDVTKPDASLNIGSGADIDGSKGTGDVDIDLPSLKVKGGKKVHGKRFQLEKGSSQKCGLFKVCICQGKKSGSASLSSDGEDDDQKKKFELEGGSLDLDAKLKSEGEGLDVDMPKGKAGSGDIDVGMDIDTDAPKVEKDIALDVAAPDASLDIDTGAKVGIEGSAGDVDVNLPSLKIKGSKKIHGKDIELEKGSGKKGGIFKVCICKGKTDSSDTDDDDPNKKLKLRGGNLGMSTRGVKGDIEIDDPSMNIGGDAEINIDGNDNLELGGDHEVVLPKGKAKVKKPKGRSRILTSCLGKGKKYDISLSADDDDISYGKRKGKFDTGSVEIKGMKRDINMGIDIDAEHEGIKKDVAFNVKSAPSLDVDAGMNISGGTMSMSHNGHDGVSLPSVAMEGGLDVSTPKVEFSQRDTDISIDAGIEKESFQKTAALDVNAAAPSMNIGGVADLEMDGGRLPGDGDLTASFGIDMSGGDAMNDPSMFGDLTANVDADKLRASMDGVGGDGEISLHMPSGEIDGAVVQEEDIPQVKVIATEASIPAEGDLSFSGGINHDQDSNVLLSGGSAKANIKDVEDRDVWLRKKGQLGLQGEGDDESTDVDALLDHDVNVVIQKDKGGKYRDSLKTFIPIRAKTDLSQSPFDQAGLFSFITHNYMNRIVYLSYKNRLTSGKFQPCSPNDAALPNAIRLERCWNDVLENEGVGEANFGHAVRRYIRTRILVCLLLLLLHLAFLIASNGVLSQFILSGLEAPAYDRTTGILLALGIGLCLLVSCLFCSAYHAVVVRTGVRTKTAIVAMMYRKLLRLQDLPDHKIQELVNICTDDSQHYLEMITLFPKALLSCVCLSVAIIIIAVILIGTTSLLGTLGLFVLVAMIQMVFEKISKAVKAKANRLTDRRARLMNDILNCMRLIKMYAWEIPFARFVAGIHREERKRLDRVTILDGISQSLPLLLPNIATTVVIIFYLGVGNNILPYQAFTVAAMMTLLYFLGNETLPRIWRLHANVKNADKRIKEFLLIEEGKSFTGVPEDIDQALVIKDATFAWPCEQGNENNNNETKGRRLFGKFSKKKKKMSGDENKNDVEEKDYGIHSDEDVEVGIPLKAKDMGGEKTSWRIALSDISFTLPKGKLFGVYEGSGSGRSSLISAVLSEMRLIDGEVGVGGTIAYVAQDAWIFNATLKDNILFDNPFDKAKYRQVLQAACLQDVIRMLPHGDLTEIGERGINLSGGQKQRVSLARALYADCDVYLLDDPLSAVDAHVGQHIFQHYIHEALRNKTVLFVTHQPQFLSRCDSVLVLKDGRIRCHGPHRHLMSHNQEYSSLINTSAKQLKAEELGIVAQKRDDQLLEESGTMINISGCEVIDDTVKSGTIGSYMKAAGVPRVIILMLLVLLFTAAVATNFWWLKYWIDRGSGNTTIMDGDTKVISDSMLDNPQFGTYCLVYGITSLLIVVLAIIQSVTFYKVCSVASGRLSNSALLRVIRSPINFFISPPTSSTLRHFSAHSSKAEVQMPILMDFVAVGTILLLIAVVSVCILLPLVIIIALPSLAVSVGLFALCRAGARDCRRLACVNRLPWISLLTSTARGKSTIHAYGKVDAFTRRFNKLLEKESVPLSMSLLCGHWGQLRVTMLYCLVVFGTAIVAGISHNFVLPTSVGLALVFALQALGLSHVLILMSTEAEARLSSVERLSNYQRRSVEEAPAKVSGQEPPEDWPQQGGVEFRNVVMRYKDGLPLVLKGVSMNVSPREKIGIVGRSGSGKSSLAVALFRLVELAEGEILIDGVDVSKMGLEDLRTKLSIIPRDPVLFAGTIRYNLDPFNEHSDEELWSALEKTYMKSAISALEKQLEAPVEENGENFSVGERQLICMARALLRNSKVVVLEEMTAALETETKETIKTVVGDAFKDCTMLTIAHTMNTVLACDRVLVMEDGKIVERGDPSTLLVDPSSKLGSMMGAPGGEVDT